MNNRSFVEGLRILSKYMDDNAYTLGADHDEIYVYQTVNQVSEEDIIELVLLGWTQGHVDYFELEDYSFEESWVARV